jgi:hypothetical protein
LFLSVWKDHPAVFDAPDWLNNVYRRAHADELNPAVEAFLGQFTMAEITELLQSKGIPCVPVNTPMGFANDEQVRERGFMVPVQHAGFGSAKQPAMPFTIDGERPVVGSVPVLDSWTPSYVSPVSGEKRERDNTLSSSAQSAGNGPLDGMRIVSFDHVLAGPTARRFLPSSAPTSSKSSRARAAWIRFASSAPARTRIFRRAFSNSTATSVRSRSILNIRKAKASCTISLPRLTRCSTTTASMWSSASASATINFAG